MGFSPTNHPFGSTSILGNLHLFQVQWRKCSFWALIWSVDSLKFQLVAPKLTVAAMHPMSRQQGNAPGTKHAGRTYVQLHPPQKSIHGCVCVCSIFFAAAWCSDTPGDVNQVWTRNDITEDPQTIRTRIRFCCGLMRWPRSQEGQRPKMWKYGAKDRAWTTTQNTLETSLVEPLPWCGGSSRPAIS